jgi:hypothetical protein
MAWLRLDCWLSLCAAVARAALPRCSAAAMSAALATSTSVAPSITIWPAAFSYMVMPLLLPPAPPVMLLKLLSEPGMLMVLRQGCQPPAATPRQAQQQARWRAGCLGCCRCRRCHTLLAVPPGCRCCRRLLPGQLPFQMLLLMGPKGPGSLRCRSQ